MEPRSVTHSTFVIERNIPAPPERVFAAFTNPETKRRWSGDSAGRRLVEFAMDFRPGGTEHAVYVFQEGTPFPGATFRNDTVYCDIVADRRIVLTYSMSMGDRRFSSSLATFEFAPSDQGTELIFTDQGAFFEGSDGPQMREEGWRKILDRLAEVTH